jgi:DNA-binding PadR family transcriptional regulator
MPRTNAELAVLTLVCERPRHGYEIEQVIEERGMREWTDIGFSSIYYLLKKLERAGLVTGRSAPAERGPSRRVYRATAAGRAEMRAATRQALAAPGRRASEIQLGLANFALLPPDEALQALEQHRLELRARLELARRRWEEQKPLPYFVEAMFEHALAMGGAELSWIEGFMRQVRIHIRKAQPPGADAGSRRRSREGVE